MNKRDLAYKLYEAGVIAFDDYQCVDCGGNNVLVDSFYACAVEIKAEAGRAGFIAGYNQAQSDPFTANDTEIDLYADEYAESVKAGEE